MLITRRKGFLILSGWCDLFPVWQKYGMIIFILIIKNYHLILKKREEQRLKATQMTFLRNVRGITKLDKEKNQCIREKTGAQNTVKEIKQYQEKWLQLIQRMDTNRIPKQAIQYNPKGRRNIRTTEEGMEGPVLF